MNATGAEVIRNHVDRLMAFGGFHQLVDLDRHYTFAEQLKGDGQT